MSNGNVSKVAVGQELVFAQAYSDANISQRLRLLAGADFNLDIGLVSADELTGTRLAAKEYSSIISGAASFGELATPEGAMGWLLKWICGTVTSVAGNYRPRVPIISSATGGEVSYDFSALATLPVEATGDSCFIRSSAGVKTLLTKAATATPAAGEYYINTATKTIYFGTALAAGDMVVLTWFETVAGVYTHIFELGDTLPSFLAAVQKGTVAYYSYKGCVANTLSMGINTSDVLTLAIEALYSDETYEGAASTWPASPTSKLVARDSLDPFLIKHAKVIIDQVVNATAQSFDISYNNAAEPEQTINCTDAVNSFTPGTVEFTASMAVKYSTKNFRDDYRALTLRDYEVRYGDCSGDDGGVEIGSTGINYQFGLWIPAGQITGDANPMVAGTMVETLDLAVKEDIALNKTYEFYLINSVASYPDPT